MGSDNIVKTEHPNVFVSTDVEGTSFYCYKDGTPMSDTDLEKYTESNDE